MTGILLICSGYNFPTPATRNYDSATVEISNSSKLFLNGKTNINRFSCYSTEHYPPLKVEFKVGKDGRNIMFTPTVLPLTISALDCGQKEINRDMQKALNSEAYPRILIELSEVAFSTASTMRNPGEWGNITADTKITISGITRPKVLCLKARRMANGTLNLTGKEELKMTEFGIEPPTTLMGLIRVQDEIEINFDLLLKIRK